MASVAVGGNPIGDLLLQEGLLTRDQLMAAVAEAKSSRLRLSYVVAKSGAVPEIEVTKLLARHYRMPAVDLTKFEVDSRTLRLIPSDVASKHIVLPLKREGRTLTIAVADPSDHGLLDDLKFITRYDLFPVIAGEVTLRALIERHYESAGNEQQLANLLKDMEGLEDDVEILAEQDDEIATREQIDDAPVVKLINGLLTDAVRRGASDIHIEPFEHEIRVRYRIDGALIEVMKPPLKLRAALTSRVKILSQLNIAERRVPQDGRLKLKMGNRVIDFRVSTLPVLFGEKIVMRILDKGNLTLDLSKFGFEPKAEQDLLKAILNPYGMVLVTGPTGSGKTTTLYSCLSRINTLDTNIMTAEDPVEYNLMGINQVLVRNEIGLTFAAALKAFLRQDPNIIMIGEIRDLETGSIAIKAALTGHLVLSTLHTNDAPSTINRLMNMGIEPFLVASSLNLVCAQRLVRRVCTNCKIDDDVPPPALEQIGFTPELAAKVKPKKGSGCEKCNKTGYKGRCGLYEVMEITDELRELILVGASALELRRKAIEEGMITLRGSGLRKITDGVTTIEEVLRETVK
jgi:type IV pilus assembly protein PilB